jgi:hydrogenase/urease accessory protein HupE
MFARNLSITLAFLGFAVQAHEIGTTRVAVSLQSGTTYDIEIVTDAAALADKLAASTGLSPGGLESLLDRAASPFRKRLKVLFDSSEAVPAIACSVAAGPDSGSSVATIRLTGTIPPDARTFSWSYGWTFASYALTIRSGPHAPPATQWLEGGQTSAPFQLAVPERPATQLQTAWRYLTLGFTHIVPHGLDHVLFVLGIYLLSGRARAVLLQVSAFTIAHSITLGLSLYGVVSVSSKIVEPMIAISIAYVAIENIFLAELKSRRVALVFAFGLLHGMGFAGALKDLGLPRAEFLTALLTFNAGVETGQLAVIGAAFLLFGWQCAGRRWYRSRIVVPASAAIACMAVYWTFERLSF